MSIDRLAIGDSAGFEEVRGLDGVDVHDCSLESLKLLEGVAINVEGVDGVLIVLRGAEESGVAKLSLEVSESVFSFRRGVDVSTLRFCWEECDICLMMAELLERSASSFRARSSVAVKLALVAVVSARGGVTGIGSGRLSGFCLSRRGAARGGGGKLGTPGAAAAAGGGAGILGALGAAGVADGE